MFDGPEREVWEQCESPIEQYLCTALFCVLGCKAVSGPFDVSRLGQLAELSGEQATCFLFAQHSIGIYRADFLLVMVDPERRRSRIIVLECDGQHYHGSDEQIARDEQRDQEIAEAGYRVKRYTGSALHSDIRGVLADVRGWIEANGATVAQRAGADFWLRFSPDKSVWSRRQAERELYWREQAEAKPAPVYDDDGREFRWADTL